MNFTSILSKDPNMVFNKDSNFWLIPILGLGAVVAGVVLANRRRIGVPDPFADRQLIRKGIDKPTIWLYYNDSDVNSRDWLDFGARSTRVLNLPFLNLCYETILRHNSDKYKIEVIGGLTGLLERLGELPGTLADPRMVVNQPELDWIRAAVLAKYGGLWLTPSAIVRQAFGPLPEDKNIFFGTDLDDTVAGSDGTTVPGMRAIWAGRSGHSTFVAMEAAARKRLDEKAGGLQVRNDAKWDYLAFAAKDKDTLVRPYEELGRSGQSGKRLQVEDILASGTEGNLPFTVGPQVIYTPILMEEITKRRNFGWFLRLSEDQILESDLAVSHLFKEALGKN